MNADDLNLTSVLFSLVGRTYMVDDREVRVLSLLTGREESFFVCVWTDTCMAFCASLYDVGMAFGPTV